MEKTEKLVLSLKKLIKTGERMQNTRLLVKINKQPAMRRKGWETGLVQK